MTRTKFMRVLKRKLRIMPEDERDIALEFYEDYFNDADSETEALLRLGDPKKLASEILIEFVEKKPNLPFLTILTTLFVITSAVPISIIFILFLVSIILFFYCCNFFLFLSSVVSLIVIIPAFTYSLSTALIYIGAALVLIPLTYYFFKFCRYFSLKTLITVKNIIFTLLKRRLKNES